MSFDIKSVLLLDSVDPICGEILTSEGIRATTSAKLNDEQLVQELAKHDAVVVRSATKITAKILEATNNLVLVGRAGTGVDNIDVKTATEKGVLVMNTPGGNTISATEQTCALICALSREIPRACASLKEGAWDRKLFMGNELYNKTLAIIGLGRIGREVSNRMKSFNMDVVGYDPLVTPEQASEWGIKYLSLEEIWPIADYITVHTPLIPQTRNLIGEKSFALCKPTVRIVNVARGGIVDEQALLKALEQGKCSGAALDVFETEPPTNTALIQHPKIICTPHLGANTKEAQKRVAMEIAQQIVDIKIGKFFGIVNSPALALADGDSGRVFTRLCNAMGSLASQIIDGTSSGSTYKLTTSSSTLSNFGKLCGPSILSGVFNSMKANLVNADSLAKSGNVSFSQEVLVSEGNKIFLEATNGEKQTVITGRITEGGAMLESFGTCIFKPSLAILPNAYYTFFKVTDTSKVPDILNVMKGSQATSLLVREEDGFVLVMVTSTKVASGQVMAEVMVQ